MRALFLIGILMLLGSSCNKDDDPGWLYCDECSTQDWYGNYSGDGSLYVWYNPDETSNVVVDVSIEPLYENTWKIVVSSEDNFILSFMGKEVDTGCFFDMAGTGKSIHLTLFNKEGEYKISGSAKSYDNTGDSVILNKSVSFEVFKLVED